MKLLRSIDRKLALVLALLLLVVGSVVIASYFVTTRLYLDEVEQRLHRELAASLVADTALLDGGEIRQEGLKEIFHTLMVVNPRIEVYLLAPDGRIVAFDAPPGRVVRERVDPRPLRRFLTGDRLPIRGPDPRDAGGEKIFSAAPIETAEGELVGYLYVVLAGEQYRSLADRLAGSYALRITAATAAAFLLVVLVAGLLLFRRVTRRLRRLDARVAAFHRREAPEEGADGEPMAIAGAADTGGEAHGDEIDRLGASFTSMAARLERQIEELRQVDRLRRELVANVSHDLRTPLASLDGYLETLLLKGSALPEEERRRFLEIAAAQSRRLSALVEDLFELAKLDAGDSELELEVFSLAELAQDLAQKYQLDASRRQVELEARLPADGAYVKADLRLIERALENFLKNALAHTEDGGRVEVEVAAAERGGDDGKVSVSIRDTGCGIPADELPRIFDRFYRGDRGRARRDGAGLGLAIARRILELHGALIDVESEVGAGTAFTFQLTAHRA